jgi:hypothetical protein
MGLFARKGDPLLERADILVHAAWIGALDTSGILNEQFPIFRRIDQAHFCFMVTIATVFVAIDRLRSADISENLAARLVERLSQRLTSWNPKYSARAFAHCKSFFERNFNALTAIDHDPKFLAADVLGTWIVWDCLDRAPEATDEHQLSRVIGVTLVEEFYDWWNV